jgi:hypothetical protein
MIITIENYFEQFPKLVDTISTTAEFQRAHDFLSKSTAEGTDNDTYYNSVPIKRMIDLYFDKLNTLINKKGAVKNDAPGVKKNRSSSTVKKGNKKVANNTSTVVVPPKENDTPNGKNNIAYDRPVKEMTDDELDTEEDEIRIKEEEDGLDDDERQFKVEVLREINRRLPKNDPRKLYSQDIPPESEIDHWRIEFRDIKKMNHQQLSSEINKVIDVKNYNGLLPEEEKYLNELLHLSKKNAPGLMVERIPDEIRFIKRFVNLHEKVKDKEDLLRFINALQKSILEKRIRKTSPYADQIVYIQDSLIKMYNSMKGKQKMSINEDVYDTMKNIASGEKVLPAINFIKSYIGMNAKPGMKERAGRLLTQIDRAYEKGKVGDNTPYVAELNQIKGNLQTFISDKRARTLDIEKSALNGLKGIMNDCSCEGSLQGVENTPSAQSSIMNSMDFAKMKFSSIGLKGKWLDFIGDPSPGFTAMVSGRPKFGKSTLCVEFAGYLARTHGPVLYVATEEGLNRTLQDKLELVKHPRLTVASFLPESLGMYQYVFLDSVTRLKLSPEDLLRLKANNPKVSFVFIFQVTKNGQFRGGNDFQHDVDIVIDVPEKGRATQMGRFNQGGEMQIFDLPKVTSYQEQDSLSGIPGKARYPAWTNAPHLSEYDKSKLKHIYDLYKRGELKQAFEYSLYSADTAIRDEIPGDIWIAIGGTLTPYGWEKFRAARAAKRKKRGKKS